MKFTRFTLTFNLKAILLLTLLLSNIFVSANETIKLQKTLNRLERKLSSHKSHSASTKKNSKSTKITTRRTHNKNKGLNFQENFKAFLIGVLAGVVMKVLGVGENIVEQLVIDAIDWCFEPTINEYQTIKKKMIKDSPCNPEIIKDLLGAEHDEIQTKCTELQTMRKVDSNEYSTLNVLLNTVSGVFKDNTDFKTKHEEFKKEKGKLEELSTKWTEKYKEVFEKKKNDKKNTPKDMRKVARTLYKSMDGFFYKDDICEAVAGCSAFTPLDDTKIRIGTAMSFLKCAATSPIKNALFYLFKDFVASLVDLLGVGFLTWLTSAIFPGVLVSLLAGFVIRNWSIMKKIVDKFLTVESDDPKTWDADRDMWNGIGRLFANGIFFLVGKLRRRKLKKFRKFDEKLF